MAFCVSHHPSKFHTLHSLFSLPFSVLEMQTILIELVENFEFSLAPGVEIDPVFATIMTPM